jgi:hypothetical protein
MLHPRFSAGTAAGSAPAARGLVRRIARARTVVPERIEAVPSAGADPERQRLVDELDAARAEAAR